MHDNTAEMNIIDISSRQSRISLRGLPNLNGAIVKATEGRGYKSGLYKNQYTQAKSLDLCRGSYHFAGDSVDKHLYEPSVEWEKFYSIARNNVRDGILVLDFEPYGYGTSIAEELNWVRQWMELAHGTTGVWPILYLDYSHIMMWHNYSPVMAQEIAKNCGLWVAGGPHYNTAYRGFDKTLTFPFQVPTYWNIVGWQYSSHGILNGYQPLDFNQFYITSEQWTKYAHGDNKVTVVPPKAVTHHKPIIKSRKVYYRIEPGDSLIRIGAKFNVPWQSIAMLNRLKPPYVIYAGHTLRVK
jgi:GH25 family lysozyme M1 (1,4-beta-N-acetylmuramidase)